MPNRVVAKVKEVEVVARAKGRAAGLAARGKARVEEVKKSTMGTHLTRNPLRDQGLADLSEAPPKDANPSIRDPENPEIQAKASDFTQDLA